MMLKRAKLFNAIQIKIDNNVRMLAELHARWEREDEIARKNNIARVYTITTSENATNTSVSKPPTINGKIIGVGNVSTSIAKCPKLLDNSETVLDKDVEISSNKEENNSITFDDNNFDFDGCNLSEVITFLQKLARTPKASEINMAFTKHLTNALIQVREEKLKREVSIPRKLKMVGSLLLK